MKYIFVFLVVLILMVLLTGAIFAADILKLADVKPGMEGIGKTVFQGDKIESFPVKIIDVLEGEGLDEDLILIRAGGDEIDRIGGIAAGMSGSPVYVDGKLLGAISYGWAFSDQHYALVTPIERMLALLDKPEEDNEEDSTVINRDLKTIKLDTGEEKTALKTPLYVSGLRGRALTRLEDGLSGYNFKVLPGSLPVKDRETDSSLEPGSAVAVQLVRGDVNIASIGTVTYQEGDDLLAFGHPFLNRGDVEYLMSAAHISSVIPSLEQPFKLGAPTDKVMGVINDDRGAGIAGKIDSYPRIIPLRVKVTDRDLKQENEVAVQLVRDESLLTPLAINVALQTLDSTLDRIGRGTARVFYKITGSGLPDLSIERNDIYYSRSDIAAMALGDFYQLIDMITSNPFKKINLIDLKLEVEVKDSDQIALLQEAKVLNEEIAPGDTLEIEVTIHPYRQEAFKKVISLELPEDVQPGMSTVIIDGGFTGQTYQLPTEDALEATTPETNQAIVQGYKSFQEMLDEYIEEPRNNELIVQVISTYPMATEEALPAVAKEDPAVAESKEGKGEDKGDLPGDQPGQKGEKTDKAVEKAENIETDQPEKPEIKKKIETDYVLEGNLTLDINIVNPEDSPEQEKGTGSGAGRGANKEPDLIQQIES